VTVATWLVCSTGVSDSTAVAQLFDEYYEFLLRSSSELATEVRRRDYDDQLGVNDDSGNRFGVLHSKRFDIREFHDVVLRNGPLPLDLLEQQVLAVN
jgi:hypothetical protein